MSDHTTPVALPQSTFNTTVIVLVPANTTRRRCPAFVGHFDFYPTLTSFVVDEVHHPLGRPVVKTFVAVPTPVIFIYATGVANN